MAKRSIVLRLRSYDYGGLALFLQGIRDKLSISTVYTSPPVSLSAQQTAIDELRQANSNWNGGQAGGKKALEKLRKKRERVENILREISSYCMSVTPDDPLSWEVLGFVTKKLPVKGSTLEAVRNLHQFIARNIKALHIKIRWERPLATSKYMLITYRVMRSADASFANAKEVALVTRTTFTDKVSQGGVLYYYFVIPINAHGSGVLSDVCVAAAMPV